MQFYNFLLEYFADKPPIFLTLYAATIALMWQVGAANLIGAIFEKFAIKKDLAFVTGWIISLPVFGALVLTLKLLGLASPLVYSALSLLVMTWGVYQTITFVGARGGRLRNALQDLSINSAIWLTGLAIHFVAFLYLAHPRRQYDQLNYHTLVSKRIFNFPQFFEKTQDDHILFAGLNEYGFTAFRALMNHDLFHLAASQASMYFVTVLGTSMAIYLIAKKLFESSSVIEKILFSCVVFLPYFIPNPAFAGVAKPGGVLFAMAVLLFAYFTTRKESNLPVYLGVCLLAGSIKLTFFHAAVSFFPVLLFYERKIVLKKTKTWWIPVLGLWAMGAFVAKNLLVFGTPFYPMDITFIDSPNSVQYTIDYWQGVAFKSDSNYFYKMLGGVFVPMSNPHGFTLLILSLLALVIKRKSIPASFKSFYGGLFIFLGFFVAVWPLFYGENIFSRFVSPYSGALIVLSIVTINWAMDLSNKYIASLFLGLSITASGLDVHLIKLVRWNQMSSWQAMENQFSRTSVYREINKITDFDDIIIADNPIKFFSTSPLLFAGLWPRSYRLWSEIKEDPLRAARTNRVKAIVLRKGIKADKTPHRTNVSQFDFVNTWEKLLPYGKIIDGKDFKALLSKCSFRSKDCTD